MKVKITVSKRNYHSYIQSSDWKSKKQKYLQSNLPKDCFCCGRKYGTYQIEFHHRTYKRLGCELLMDIVPVCRECHQKVHDRNKDGDNLWKSTSKIKSKNKRKLKLINDKTAEMG